MMQNFWKNTSVSSNMCHVNVDSEVILRMQEVRTLDCNLPTDISFQRGIWRFRHNPVIHDVWRNLYLKNHFDEDLGG